MKLFKYLLLLMGLLKFQAQQISMDFPRFAGKNYDFIIFQGDQQVTIKQDTIPVGGKFTLTIPEEYAPYTGMTRWLITGTKEGGGLDMYVPGKDFSVICNEVIPNEKNIIYKNNTSNRLLNELYWKEEKIMARYEVMQQTLRVFDKTDPNYSIFNKESHKQQDIFDIFQSELKKRGDYISQFTQIVNITRGTGTKLFPDKEQKARNIADYIANELNWNFLYTSGHWKSIISTWIQIQTSLLKDVPRFKSDFIKISSKIKSTVLYADFAGSVSFYLNQLEKPEYIKTISPVVISSGKINEYKGSLLYYTQK